MATGSLRVSWVGTGAVELSWTASVSSTFAIDCTGISASYSTSQLVTGTSGTVVFSGLISGDTYDFDLYYGSQYLAGTRQTTNLDGSISFASSTTTSISFTYGTSSTVSTIKLYHGSTLVDSITGSSTGGGTATFTGLSPGQTYRADFYHRSTLMDSASGDTKEEVKTCVFTSVAADFNSISLSWSANFSFSGTIELFKGSSYYSTKSISGTSGSVTFTGLSQNTRYSASIWSGSTVYDDTGNITTAYGTISNTHATDSTLEFYWSSSIRLYSGAYVRLYSGGELIASQSVSGTGGYVNFTGLSTSTTYTARLIYDGSTIDSDSGTTTGPVISITSFTALYTSMAVNWLASYSLTSLGATMYLFRGSTLVTSKSLSGTSGTEVFSNLTMDTTYTVDIMIGSTLYATQNIKTYKGTVVLSSRTNFSLTFAWSSNIQQDSYSMKLYTSGGSLVSTKTIGAGLSGSVTFSGLTPNTTYLVEFLYGGEVIDADTGTTTFEINPELSLYSRTSYSLTFLAVASINQTYSVVLYSNGTQVGSVTFTGTTHECTFTGLAQATTYLAVMYYGTQTLTSASGTTTHRYDLTAYWVNGNTEIYHKVYSSETIFTQADAEFKRFDYTPDTSRYRFANNGDIQTSGYQQTIRFYYNLIQYNDITIYYYVLDTANPWDTQNSGLLESPQSTFSVNIKQAPEIEGKKFIAWVDSNENTYAPGDPYVFGSVNYDEKTTSDNVTYYTKNLYAVYKEIIPLFNWTSNDDANFVSGADPTPLLKISKWNEMADIIDKIDPSIEFPHLAPDEIENKAYIFSRYAIAIASLPGATTGPGTKIIGQAAFPSDYVGANSLKTALNNAITYYNNNI